MGTGFLGEELRAGSGRCNILINPQIMVGKIPFQPALPVEEAEGGQSLTSLRSAWRGALSNITHLEIPLKQSTSAGLQLHICYKTLFNERDGAGFGETLGPLIDVEIF